MPYTLRFDERIGKVFLPEAGGIQTEQSPPSGLSSLEPLEASKLTAQLEERAKLPGVDLKAWKFCSTTLKSGCYTMSFIPDGTPVFGTRFRGTFRFETLDDGIHMSGDLYTYRLFDDVVVRSPLETMRVFGPIRRELAAIDRPVVARAVDNGGAIPIYSRRSYHSYLKGTSANLFSIIPSTAECSFTLNLDEFVYNQPATGFMGTFNSSPTRSIRFILRHTAAADSYSGEAYQVSPGGTTHIGTVSIHWISRFFRRAHLQLNTLTGFESPPASVDGSTFSSIFSDAGWALSFTDGGTVPLPAALSGINVNTCWSLADLHTLMSSVPGYNSADLDSVWRVHLVSVPAQLGCSRGVMFDSTASGTNPNAVPREGAATFSRDGYPANEVPDGVGGSHYDSAAGKQQRTEPRAFLRSAAHEIGHAFNQIHQGFELGNDNSEMTPTPSVATVIGLGGTFPDDINLGFNDTVKHHLKHLPDPAVRPGAMDFFGSAVSSPQASDVAWPETLKLTVTPSSDQVTLGEPIDLTFRLMNEGSTPIPVPDELDVASLTARINVADPSGRIRFMRPHNVSSCPRLGITELAPGKWVEGHAQLFWGTEGFAFETPGRHIVEVIVLWNVAGVHVAASGSNAVFVGYPVSKTDNDMAALLLDPDVGRAVATGRAWVFEEGARRIKEAINMGKSHPAAKAIAQRAILTPPHNVSAQTAVSKRIRTPKRPS